MGHFHPENVIDNGFLEDLDIGTSDEWILERVGIRRRRTVLPLDYIRSTYNRDPRGAGEAALYDNADTAARAAAMALERAGVACADIGLVVSGGCYPDMAIPADASRVAAAAGIDAPGIDINSACCSFGAQLHMLGSMEGLPRFVLVVNPENTNAGHRLLRPRQRRALGGRHQRRGAVGQGAGRGQGGRQHPGGRLQALGRGPHPAPRPLLPGGERRAAVRHQDDDRPGPGDASRGQQARRVRRRGAAVHRPPGQPADAAGGSPAGPGSTANPTGTTSPSSATPGPPGPRWCSPSAGRSWDQGTASSSPWSVPASPGRACESRSPEDALLRVHRARPLHLRRAARKSRRAPWSRTRRPSSSACRRRRC